MCMLLFSCLVFFFKQKTAYEMRISDWSSDVCSSDLSPKREGGDIMTDRLTIRRPDDWHVHLRDGAMLAHVAPYTARQFARAIVDAQACREIGRASCRERVCQYV